MSWSKFLGTKLEGAMHWYILNRMVPDAKVFFGYKAGNIGSCFFTTLCWLSKFPYLSKEYKVNFRKNKHWGNKFSHGLPGRMLCIFIAGPGKVFELGISFTPLSSLIT